MKVDIKHHEKTEGLFKKRTFHVVDLTVTLSEEERQIVKDADLGSFVVINRGVPADRNPAEFKNIEDVFDLRVSKLAKGETDSYAFATSHEASEYADALRELLPKLKSYIMERGSVELKNDSFEI